MSEEIKMSRGKAKLVSMICPSRGRIDLIKKTIDSVYNNAKDPSNIEFLIRLDNDDTVALSRISEITNYKLDTIVIVGERFRGYRDLHIYVNEMCALSRGEFIFLFNDDSEIVSKDWEQSLIAHRKQTIILNPFTTSSRTPPFPPSWQQPLNTFPIISRDIYDAMGHFALQAHNDSWIVALNKRLKIEKPINDIKIYHDRADKTGNNNDQTWKDRKQQWTTSRAEFDGAIYNKLRDNDYKKLCKLLGK